MIEVDEQQYGKLIDIAPPHEGKKKKGSRACLTENL
jgi:hypothetical protein